MSSTISIEAGKEIALKCETPNSVILYTLDGSEPDAGSIVDTEGLNGTRIYKEPIYILPMMKGAEIKAKGTAPGIEDSEVTGSVVEAAFPKPVVLILDNKHVVIKNFALYEQLTKKTMLMYAGVLGEQFREFKEFGFKVFYGYETVDNEGLLVNYLNADVAESADIAPLKAGTMYVQVLFAGVYKGENLSSNPELLGKWLPLSTNEGFFSEIVSEEVEIVKASEVTAEEAFNVIIAPDETTGIDKVGVPIWNDDIKAKVKELTGLEDAEAQLLYSSIYNTEFDCFNASRIRWIIAKEGIPASEAEEIVNDFQTNETALSNYFGVGATQFTTPEYSNHLMLILEGCEEGRESELESAILATFADVKGANNTVATYQVRLCKVHPIVIDTAGYSDETVLQTMKDKMTALANAGGNLRLISPRVDGRV